jgi:anti-sigma factor ChrR (cupin superfamily)
VALYALGTLEPGERAALEAHLAEGCEACRTELAELTAVTAPLGYLATHESPRAELRRRLLAGVPATPVDETPLVVRAGDDGWMPGPIPGMTVRPLFRDAAGQRSTQLVRVTPGVTYPTHRHADTEEIYLLDGDLLVNGEVLATGDYCAALAGSVHEEIATHTGCAFISTSSERDVLVAEQGTATPGLVFVRAAERTWQPAAERVEMMPIFSPPGPGLTTALVRMLPGATLPAHRHASVEQCYMIAGERQVGGDVLRAGDYWRAEAGTLHAASTSAAGCTYLLVASRAEA